MMSERTFKPVDAYVEAAPDEGLIVLCRLGAPNLPRNDYYIAEHDEVTIYPGHEERLTEAEWLERSKPQVDAKLIERAREALARWAVVGMAPDGERLFHALRDLLAALEAGDARTPVPPELLEQAQAERDHLRRALEWLALRKAGAIGAGGGQDFEIDCGGQRKGRAKNAEDWAAAALAATEEAHECRYCEGRGAVLGALGEDGDGYEVPCPRCNPLATEEAPDE